MTNIRRSSQGRFIKGERGLTFKHGQSAGSGNRSTAYSVWDSMKQRCLNPKNASYKNYGGRGITICERWMDFENFLADMGQPPKGQWLERIDNNGPYSPENCRWATPSQQNRNTRRNHYIEHNGQRKLVVEWAEESGINKGALLMRIRKGWSMERALSEPVRPTAKKGRRYV